MTPVRSALLAGLLLLALFALGAGRAEAQGPPAFWTGVQPDTVTVGDRFVVALRARLPPGATAELPAGLDSTPDLHPVGPRVGHGASAPGDVAAAYPMVAWRPGAPAPLFAAVRVVHPDGRVATVRVALPLPFVRSVLPADSSQVEPRGPKDVIGPNWDPRLVALLVALVVLALLLLPTGALVRRWLRRRRERRDAMPRDPRAYALALLERARKAPCAERAEWKAFYTLTSEALRGYLAALSPRWGADLTTAELAVAMNSGPGVRPGDAATLLALLAEADAVKFARGASTPQDAERHWRQARDWVAGFEPESVDAPDEAGETAEVGR